MGPFRHASRVLLTPSGPLRLFAGMALYLTLPWWVLAVLLLVVFMQVWRARNEARVLEAKFGDAYREYRRKTWF